MSSYYGNPEGTQKNFLFYPFLEKKKEDLNLPYVALDVEVFS